MIINFADRETERFYNEGKAKKIPQDITRKAILLLDLLDGAVCIQDLQSPPGNRLHRLTGDLHGYWSISINMQWRIIFTFDNKNAYNVEIIDYH